MSDELIQSAEPLLLSQLLCQLFNEYAYYDDSYGVDGSDFNVCSECGAENGAGVLRHPFEHAEDCQIAKYEHELDELLGLSAPPATVSDEFVLVPREPTEEIIDSVRYMITGIDLHSGRRTIGNFRTHCTHSGVDFSCWPDWATNGEHDDEHLTKAGIAILFYHTFLAASPPAAQPSNAHYERANDLIAELREWANYKFNRKEMPATTDMIDRAANWIEQHDTQTAQPSNALSGVHAYAIYDDATGKFLGYGSDDKPFNSEGKRVRAVPVMGKLADLQAMKP